MKINLILGMALLISCSSYAENGKKDNKFSDGKYTLSLKMDGGEKTANLTVSIEVKDTAMTMRENSQKEKLTGVISEGKFTLKMNDRGNNIIYEGMIDAKGGAHGSWNVENNAKTVGHGTFTLQKKAVTDATVQEGIAALNRDDFKTAYKKFLPLAENGDDKSMITIGLMFHEGQGFKQDYAKAMDWYIKAFRNQNGDAYSNIGVMYRDGLGVKKNKKIAYCLFLITHVCSLGSESTQYLANSCLRRIIPEMSKEELKECLNYTLEYIQAYVESRGTLKGIPKEYQPAKDKVALKDKPWWVKGELDFLKEDKNGQQKIPSNLSASGPKPVEN